MMMTDVPRLGSSSTVLDAVERFSAADGPSHIPVVDADERFLGFVSHAGLFTEMLSGGVTVDATALTALMENISAMADTGIRPLIEEPSSSVPPEASMMEVAAHFMEGGKGGRTPLAVVDNQGRLLGVITPGAVFKRLWDFRLKS
jgi:CBS-domain-containing membrane protein